MLEGDDSGSNVSTDPSFELPALGDFHLASDSPLDGVTDPDATLSVDFDGDPRPLGDGRDPGADEMLP